METKKELLSRITELLTPILEDRGLELVDVQYSGEGKGKILRIYIDKDTGVTIDDCVWVSKEFGTVLDVYDIIPTSYRLEVSSPGLRRVLRKPEDFSRFKGRKAKIKTNREIEGKTFFLGVLGDSGDEEVEVIVDGVSYSIPFDSISKANLEIDF